MSVKQFFEKNKVAIFLWGLFLLSSLVHAVIAGFPKHILVLYDELYYYSYAENLAKGRGFPMIYQFYYNVQNRFLYSILISPAFFTTNRIIQFRLIALINSMILCSGVFPVYLLSKKVIGRKNWSLVCAILLCLMPDMAYSISFMADIPMLPLGLWMMYAIYSIFDSKEKKAQLKMIAFFCILQILVMWSKRSGILFTAVLLAMFIIYEFIPMIRNTKIKKKQMVAYAICMSILLLTIYVVMRAMKLDGVVEREILAIINNLSNGGFELAKRYIYYIIQLFIAAIIIPIVVPLIYYKDLDEKGKRLLWVNAITTLVFSFLINVGSADSRVIGRIQLRYLMFLWMPFIILFLKVLLEKEVQSGLRERVAWGAVCLAVFAISMYYRGPFKASDIEYTMLYWVEKWEEYRFVFVTCIIVLVALTSFLMIRKERSILIIIFLCIWIAIQSYNSYMAYSRYSESYKMDISEIDEVEAFINNHPDDIILVANTGQSKEDYNRADSFNYLSTKIADTYLNYPNVLRVSLPEILGIESLYEQRIYIVPAYPFRVDFIKVSQLYDEKSVDYIVIPKDAGTSVDVTGCTPVPLGEEERFLIYKLNDPTIIPRIDSIRYLQSGMQSFQVDDGVFSSQYKKGGKSSFESTDEMDAYVLYGPYSTLRPGEYKITLNYSFNGQKEIGEIGFADINGDGINPDDFKEEMLADSDMVELNLTTNEEIRSFEIRAFAEEEGIKIKSIDIYYEPYMGNVD